MMRKIIALIILGMFAATAPAAAANPKGGSKSTPGSPPTAKPGAPYAPKTGDKDLDLVLSNLNVEAGLHVDAFVSELSISYALPKVQIEDLVYNRRMPFGDVFISVWLASSLRKPLSVVVREYELNRDKGWGVMARNLGIQPGSKEFHSLKKDGSVELELAQRRNKEKKAEKPEKPPASGSKGKSKK